MCLYVISFTPLMKVWPFPNQFSWKSKCSTPLCAYILNAEFHPDDKVTVEIIDRNLFTSLTLTPLTWRIRWAPNNASRWQMGFNSAFEELKCPLTLILLTWRIWWAPNNASRWQMGFNSGFKGLKCPLTLTLLTWRIWWAPNNASRWDLIRRLKG